MLKLFLWLRYMHKRKIVLLSVAAVALSCALMIIVNSLFTGFIDAVRASYAADAGDVLMYCPRSIPEYEDFMDELEELDVVEAAAPVSFGAGLLHLETGDVREVMVQGIEPEREKKFTDFKAGLIRQGGEDKKADFQVPGFPDATGAWLGVNVAADPNEKTDEYDEQPLKKMIGKRVLLITTDATGKRKTMKLRICDIAFTSTYFGDKTLYLPFEKFHSLRVGQEETGHTRRIKIKLAAGIEPRSAKIVIADTWRQFAANRLKWTNNAIEAVSIWAIEDELNSDYFAELRKQMNILLLIFGVICSVAVLLVFCIFYMIVETKLKDIAIIKSCGATSLSVVAIFTGFGGCIGVVGSAFGIVIGMIITKNINEIAHWVRIVFGMKLWRSSSYILNEIPNQVNWSAVGWIVPAAVVGCCIGALVPAIVAARTNPVEILRYE